ncbi:hypothetical protein [Chitinilyticum litopenaei]|uniref:hypothetical protein n=1 Tax=Chitinilyticum litopenaei TaxID=1121276 RepID=UPI000428C1AA|nr:hypothetical protein [Chitinilyticum litopenaei]
MKKWLLAAALGCAATLAAAADVGVSVTIGDPRFYGRITLGNAPAPRLLYPEPVVVVRQPHYYEPIYLRVPPGHAKKWYKHCRRYSACGRPVYFVRDDWYQQVYVPYYRHRHERGDGWGRYERRYDEPRHDDGRWRGHGQGGRDRDRYHD